MMHNLLNIASVAIGSVLLYLGTNNGFLAIGVFFVALAVINRR